MMSILFYEMLIPICVIFFWIMFGSVFEKVLISVMFHSWSVTLHITFFCTSTHKPIKEPLYTTMTHTPITETDQRSKTPVTDRRTPRFRQLRVSLRHHDSHPVTD